MTINKCPNCKIEFTGRENQRYCSTRCKSAVNNARINERDKISKAIESKMRANRKILMMLEQVYGQQELPPIIIKNSCLNQTYKTGLATNEIGEKTIFFYDYSLTYLVNKNYKISKTQLR